MANAICFVEYRIKNECEEQYRAWIQAKRICETFTIYEGTDQPLLFVEVWEAASVMEAEHIKEERRDERSSWGEMNDWVEGGLNKIHAWTFQPFKQ